MSWRSYEKEKIFKFSFSDVNQKFKIKFTAISIVSWSEKARNI